LCIINTPGRLLFPRPAAYNASTFELLVRYAVSLSAKYGPDGPPFDALVSALAYNGFPANASRPMRYDLCEDGDSAVSTDEPSRLYGDYVRGNRSTRAAVAEAVKQWVSRG
jgi:hypothetical protein